MPRALVDPRPPIPVAFRTGSPNGRTTQPTIGAGAPHIFIMRKGEVEKIKPIGNHSLIVPLAASLHYHMLIGAGAIYDAFQF